MSGVVFLDTETTGLDPTRHEVWEIGLIYDEGKEVEWQLPVDLALADPMGLSISRFYERRTVIAGLNDAGRISRSRWNAKGDWNHIPPSEIAQTLAHLTDGKHVVGAVPSFDTSFLGPWMRLKKQCPTWHYHLVDVEALAAGLVGWRPPWDSEDLSRAVGVDPADFERHTALGDARWAKAIYDTVMEAKRS